MLVVAIIIHGFMLSNYVEQGSIVFILLILLILIVLSIILALIEVYKKDKNNKK